MQIKTHFFSRMDYQPTHKKIITACGKEYIAWDTEDLGAEKERLIRFKRLTQEAGEVTCGNCKRANRGKEK